MDLEKSAIFFSGEQIFRYYSFRSLFLTKLRISGAYFMREFAIPENLDTWEGVEDILFEGKSVMSGESDMNYHTRGVNNLLRGFGLCPVDQS